MTQFIFRSQLAFLLLSTLFIVGCAAQQSEDQALAGLRGLTSNGKLPPESVVADLEKRFAGRRTGALARLLRARIKLEQGDAAGAADLLKDGSVFQKQTKIADHALWLRGKAVQTAGDHVGAMAVLSQLVREHPDSIRSREAKLLWAASASAAGRAVEVPPMLVDLSEKHDADALLATAKAYEIQGSQAEAVRYFRRTYFYGAGTAAAKEAEAKLTAAGQALSPQNAEEQLARAEKLLAANAFGDAATAYTALAAGFPAEMKPDVQVKRVKALAAAGRLADAQSVAGSLPTSSPKEREQAMREVVLGHAKAKQWVPLRSAVDGMRAAFPAGTLVPKTMIDAGIAARDGRNRTDAAYYFNTALAAYPNAVEVAQAQFEAAWLQHEQGNFAVSSQMLIEHLAKYAHKDTTNRGKAGYWAARDSERAGRLAEACSLYEAVSHRYGANWYGYLADQRRNAQSACRGGAAPAASQGLLSSAMTNLRSVTVAAETAGESELARSAKGDELSIVGLFDWAADELNEARKSAANSPSVNLALARLYRRKGDQVNALLTLAKSYPDYAQMFPEEMGREEWDIFYPLTNWGEIKKWAAVRQLDPYQVAGVIRQETIFDADAESHAAAYGLMQLLLPTAKSMARKYGASTMPTSKFDLFNPALNIELGTAYMKDQFDKFGRFEYVGIAYNAGPGRVTPWRAQLPPEMDDFVENIPFKETKGYVQGIIRNSAQYKRLYDANGNFKQNVGTKPLRAEIDSKPREQVVAENPELTIDEGKRGAGDER